MSKRLNSPDTDADRDLRHLLDSNEVRNFTVIAGAGSGKTTSLIKALAHIVESQGDRLRVEGRKVACITYTNIAASEIVDEVGTSPVVHVATIHSFFWTLIKPFQTDIRVWVKEQIESLLEELYDQQAKFSNRVQEKKRIDVANRIEKLSRARLCIDDVEKFTYGIGRDFSRGILGHEDITTIVPDLVKTRPLLSKLIAEQYPIIFIDESQDTLSEIVECFRYISVNNPGFRLGFFGDPMQKIYVRGVGQIATDKTWSKIEKPENFRSPTRVLATINAIRFEGDGLQQATGRDEDKRIDGEVNFFVLPADKNRVLNMEAALIWLERNSQIGAWSSQNKRNDKNIKILVIAHRMAARRMQFEALYETFHKSPFKDAFDEGRAWPIAPFLSTLIPLTNSVNGDRSQLVPILQRSSPLLNDGTLGSANARTRLQGLSTGVDELARIISRGGTNSVRDALRVGYEAQLITLDERMQKILVGGGLNVASELISDEEGGTIGQFLQSDVREMVGYSKYINQESPYSTHQGVKGAEYPDVLVVLDDEEGQHRQFSYEKLLGVKALSDQDIKRSQEGAETIVERTRRLLYVCASRATRALGIVLYSDDVELAKLALRTSRIPGTEKVVDANQLA